MVCWSILPSLKLITLTTGTKAGILRYYRSQMENLSKTHSHNVRLIIVLASPKKMSAILSFLRGAITTTWLNVMSNAIMSAALRLVSLASPNWILLPATVLGSSFLMKAIWSCLTFTASPSNSLCAGMVDICCQACSLINVYSRAVHLSVQKNPGQNASP